MSLTPCAAAPGTLLAHHGRCDCLGERTNPPVWTQAPPPQPPGQAAGVPRLPRQRRAGVTSDTRTVLAPSL